MAEEPATGLRSAGRPAPATRRGTGRGPRADRGEQAGGVARADERAGDAVEVRDRAERQRRARGGAGESRPTRWREAEAAVTATVSAADGGVHLAVVVTRAVAVSFTEVTEVALAATGICALSETGCLSDTELTVQLAVPSPLAQPPVKVGLLAGRLGGQGHRHGGRRTVVLGRDLHDVGRLLAAADAGLRALDAHAEFGLGGRAASGSSSRSRWRCRSCCCSGSPATNASRVAETVAAGELCDDERWPWPSGRRAADDGEPVCGRRARARRRARRRRRAGADGELVPDGDDARRPNRRLGSGSGSTARVSPASCSGWCRTPGRSARRRWTKRTVTARASASSSGGCGSGGSASGWRVLGPGRACARGGGVRAGAGGGARAGTGSWLVALTEAEVLGLGEAARSFSPARPCGARQAREHAEGQGPPG